VTTTIPLARYERVHASLWHDTGRHVVVLPLTRNGSVHVLEGGSALVWRVLEQPGDVTDLLGRLVDMGVDPPPASDLTDCMQSLAERGVLFADSR
jgi:hypothetical protein